MFFFFLFFKWYLCEISMLEDCDDRRHEHFQYFNPLSGLNLEPIMNTFKHSSSKLQNVCMGATNEVFCNPSMTKEDTFRAISPKPFTIVSEMCSEGAPKPNLNPLVMYNTLVWHSWVSARPFKATLIFFYLQSCKSEEGKGRREVTHFDSAVADFVPVDLQCSAVLPKSRRRSWGEPWRTSNTYFSYSALSGQGQRSRIQHANGKSRKNTLNVFKICIKCINK